ncbi:MAG: 4-alpha-glucanotransferase [Prevotellaceae bacterium]|jgi:4-alpha-glucanotransferase|nr:4-alpha-glucanotransferase [Prevotellaceae bacterium]
MALITFTLSYESTFGEELFIYGNIRELGLTEERAVPLTYTKNGWEITIQTQENKFEYSYLVKKGGTITRKEAPLSHSFNIPVLNYKEIRIYDYFTEKNPFSKAMLSAVFSKSIMAHAYVEKDLKGVNVPVIFNTSYPQVSNEHVLAISGSDTFLGKWTEADMKEMNGGAFPEFYLVCDAHKLFFPIEYKYVILDKKNETVIRWEEGRNRYLNPTESLSTDLIIINDHIPEFNIPAFKGAGVNIPVFSLRSEKGFGTGEFEDLKLMIDWAAKTGQKMIQMLPVNDTTTFGKWKDSYPYNAISVYALHPMFLNLEKAGKIDDIEQYETLRRELNASEFVEYETVNQHKWTFIAKLFKKEKSKTFKSEAYRLFYEENKNWLQPYAVFCFLRDKYQSIDFSLWEEDATFQPERVAAYCDPGSKEYDSVAIHFFVQFHLHKQLSEVTAYAHEKGIALKGDIPIGVNRCSVETWTKPRLFDRTGQTGAPPDDFSNTGQNWGFPTYNWDEMAEDNYKWWTLRFQNMAQYFDAYRIDHILGFFRIFRIPSEQVWGVLGQFSPALPLSVEEIKKFGIDFNEKEFCNPYIIEEHLDTLFGAYKESVRKKYLKPLGETRFQLKKEVDTQRKIEQLFAGASSQEEITVRDGLMSLVCEVLFIPDIKEKSKYHPRITVQHSLTFQTLNTATKEALNNLYVNYYYSRHNDFWKEQAMQKLPPLIRSTNMLVCGEDLGMIPQCVPDVMSQLEILSLEIERMPKQPGVEFEELETIPYLSVCATSTHDMSPIRGWWEENPQRTQRYFNNVLHEYGPAPRFGEPWICREIIEKHLHSPAMWVILPFQDWISMEEKLWWGKISDERINDPSDPDNRWKYRMHITLEELLEQENFNREMKRMIKETGR